MRSPRTSRRTTLPAKVSWCESVSGVAAVLSLATEGTRLEPFDDSIFAVGHRLAVSLYDLHQRADELVDVRRPGALVEEPLKGILGHWCSCREKTAVTKCMSWEGG